jgi:SAM-dependent methyltransferase
VDVTRRPSASRRPPAPSRSHRGSGPTRRESPAEGWHGWDEYAPFYDWENARTLGRRDVPFWQRLAAAAAGSVLELGCGTGRVTMPLARHGVAVVGIDRSAAMLAQARRRVRRQRKGVAPRLVRGDIRHLPFPDGAFPLAIAPYGILQSLLSERDLASTLADVARVVARGGLFGLELVADLPSWGEYSTRVRLRGRRGRGPSHVTLREAVRQDRAKRLTIFDQEFVERRGARVRRHRFALRFRTVSVPQMARRLRLAGFRVESLLGDYQGGPWDPRAEVWIILARKD